MRLQLNLNQYYDGLNISQVNAIFSLFMDLKRKIEQMELTLNKTGEQRTHPLWEVTYSVYKSAIVERVTNINQLLVSLEKEPFYDLPGEIMEQDLKNIIEKYKYLMSKPEEA